MTPEKKFWNLMSNRFDDCMSLTSLWILVSAWIVRGVEPTWVLTLMAVQSLVSLLYWTRRESCLLAWSDRFLSSIVFLYFVSKTSISCSFLPLLSFLCFLLSCNLRCRKRWCDHPTKTPFFFYLLPHASFRFFAFWMVVLSATTTTCLDAVLLSSLYYSTLLLF